MPSIDEKVYSLDTRVSEVEKQVSLVASDQDHCSIKVTHMEEVVIKHMEKEERDREAMDGKIDGLMRYKWILFGMAVMMWLTSGENQILQLLKAVH